MEETKKIAVEEIATQIVDAAYHIFRRLGPGLYESAYETILCHELERRGLQIQRQVAIPLVWDGMLLDDCYRADLLVEGTVLIELKSLDVLPPVAARQILTYLRLSKTRLGFLLNFGAATFAKCVHRFVDSRRYEQTNP